MPVDKLIHGVDTAITTPIHAIAGLSVLDVGLLGVGIYVAGRVVASGIKKFRQGFAEALSI